MNLEKLEGQRFIFATNFKCWIEGGEVLIEAYFEGVSSLGHIKTEKQFISLYEALTGKVWTFKADYSYQFTNKCT